MKHPMREQGGGRIATATHGREGLGRLVEGSVTEQVLRNAREEQRQRNLAGEGDETLGNRAAARENQTGDRGGGQ